MEMIEIKEEYIDIDESHSAENNQWYIKRTANGQTTYVCQILLRYNESLIVKEVPIDQDFVFESPIYLSSLIQRNIFRKKPRKYGNKKIKEVQLELIEDSIEYTEGDSHYVMMIKSSESSSRRIDSYFNGLTKEGVAFYNTRICQVEGIRRYLPDLYVSLQGIEVFLGPASHSKVVPEEFVSFRCKDLHSQSIRRTDLTRKQKHDILLRLKGRLHLFQKPLKASTVKMLENSHITDRNGLIMKTSDMAENK